MSDEPRPKALFPFRLSIPSICAAGIIILYLFGMALAVEPVSVGIDSNGYYIQARLLVDEGRLWFERESPMQFISPHWLKADGDRFISRYPPGFGLLLAPFYAIGGFQGMAYANAVFSALTLLGLYLVAREWTSPWWALAACALMAINPIANEWALTGFAHSATSFFLVWGVYFLTKWQANLSPLAAAGIGFWFAYIPALRYPEGLFIGAAGLFMLLHANQGRRVWQSLAAFVVGASIPLIALSVYNSGLYGSAAETGYGDGTSLFGFGYFLQKALPYAFFIFVVGLPVVAAVGSWALIKMALRPDYFKRGILLAALIAPITVLYTAYFFFDMSLRFLYPTFYLYTLAAVWYLSELCQRKPKLTTGLLAASFVATLIVCAFMANSRLGQNLSDHQTLAEVTDSLQDYAPEGSIIIAPQNVQMQLDFIGAWRLADSSFFTRGGFPEPGGPGMGPPPGMRGDHEGPRRGPGGGPGGDVMRELMQDDGQAEARERYRASKGSLSSVLISDLSEWSHRCGGIYWLGSLEEIQRRDDVFAYDILAEIKAPSGMMGGPPPMMMGGMPPDMERGNRAESRLEPPQRRPEGKATQPLVLARLTIHP